MRIINLILCLALAFGGILTGLDTAAAASKQILTAAHVKSAPTGLDDSAWDKAKKVVIPFEGKERFADTGITADKDQSSRYHSTAQDPVQFTHAGHNSDFSNPGICFWQGEC